MPSSSAATVLEHRPAVDIAALLDKQRRFFVSGQTRPLEFRRAQLKKLDAAIKAYETRIQEALKADLGRHPTESSMVETMVCGEEIFAALAGIDEWVQDRPVSTPLAVFPAHSYIRPEPKGVVLVIAPWNYPMQLAIAPLIAAISAGCCTVIKPSELTPQTSRVIAQLVSDTFDPAFVAVVEGGIEASTRLLDEKWDHIFYTGSTQVGRVIMEKAAKHLTPVTLELGGKSPTFVTKKAKIKWAAKRIAWGKNINAGQTCIAPDYVLVERSVADELMDAYKTSVQERYGANLRSSPDFPRIVNQRHLTRLSGYLKNGTVRWGGEVDEADRFMAPSIMTDVALDSPVMTDEIFGPILPFIPFDTLDEALAISNARSRPLAMYLFSEKRSEIDYLMQRQISGGAAVNDTINHYVNHHLPFGGVGDSGMGGYHGQFGFDVFSHQRGVYEKRGRIENPLLSAPYEGKLSKLKKLVPFVHFFS